MNSRHDERIAIADTTLGLRPCAFSDWQTLLKWRNHPQIVALSTHKVTVSEDEHRAWLSACLAAPERHRIFIVDDGTQPVGMVRFDADDDGIASISAYLDPAHIGHGYGSTAIGAASAEIFNAWSQLRRIEAHVLDSNARGQAGFAKAGFRAAGASSVDAHCLLVRERDADGWLADREHAQRLYTQSVAAHDEPHLAARWGSKASQHLRFGVLEQMGITAHSAVLDVGSGLGDFYAWLRERGHVGRYCGIDATASMVEAAAARFPGVEFRQTDILSLQPRATDAFDYVCASGIFAFCRHDPYGFLHAAVSGMFALARRGVAFNCLSTWGPQPEPGECQFDPARCVDLMREISPAVTLRHDYLPHDFTIYLRRNER